MNWLLDTHVISELARREPEAAVLRWAATVGAVALSVVTVEEIHYGLAWRPNARIAAWFDGFIAAAQVLPVDADIARRAGELRGALAARGQVRTQADMLIAATAQVHRLTVVTRNLRDFDGCGIGLLDPFRLAVRLPVECTRAAGLKEGDTVEAQVSPLGEITLTPDQAFDKAAFIKRARELRASMSLTEPTVAKMRQDERY